ncbi:MAG: DNA repair protein RadA [Gammaproteobacteria bacterium]|mgnify:FL=1|jgi:DNA repair protein RadA/Sms|nr:DNA repair protein RadA [Gammaproteobacteria bacterium]
MAKQKTAFVCNECGSDYSKWQGQCNDCGAWNCLQEIRLGSVTKGGAAKVKGYAGVAAQLVDLSDVDIAKVPRFSTAIGELDRVLGGGLVPGSAILIGGHPGAGKSTLLLQLMCSLAQQMPALYVTGEESLQQVALRAQRLELPTTNLKMLAETDVESIIATADSVKPKLLVVDSIQVMQLADITSAPGSVSQVRECAAALVRYAKQSNTVLLLVGHVTKDGSLAGPKVLEHMIDCSLQLEGDHDSRFRTLRGHKNRFGAVNELGVFAMLETGLKEVKNPSSIFLSRAEGAAAGSLVMVVWEGTRPLLVELQALVDDSHFNNPRRVAIGLDQNRLAMLLAILHRHGGLETGDQDVFVNVVGGVRVNETSADLAILMAIVSSLRGQPLDQQLVVFGEVGLAGEIRPVPSGQERIREAAKHGFTRAIVPIANVPKASKDPSLKNMQIVGVKTLQDALNAL